VESEGKYEAISRRFHLRSSRFINPVQERPGWGYTEFDGADFSGRVGLQENSRAGMGRSALWIAVAEHKPAKTLSASAVGYYGRQQPGDDAVLTKSDCPQPTFISDLCPSGSKPRMAQLPMA
jgi:hypothetical protein